MNVSFAVQAHPSRALMAEQLASRIGGEVVWDPDPEGAPSTFRTFRHLMETTPGPATHRVQVQDDAEVCPYFHETVLRAVAARPDRLLLLFVSGNPHFQAQAVMDACRRDEPWAELQFAYWCPLVATVWPCRLICGLLDYVDAQRGPAVGSTRSWWETGADDEIVGRFIRDTNEPPLATVPSLVEHPDEVPSVMNPRRGLAPHGRRAACYIGACDDCTDPRTIDWAPGAGALTPA